MTSAASIDHFFEAYDPAGTGGGVAEVAAHLSGLLAVRPEALDRALAGLPPARLARIIETPEGARLRARFALADAESVAGVISAAHERVAEQRACPLRALAEALDERRRSVSPQRLADAIEDAKARLLAGWARALDRLVPAGHGIDEGVLRALGLGQAVFAALCADLGLPDDRPIPRELCLAALPRLVRFWPLTQEGLDALSALERVLAEAGSEGASVVSLEARR